MHRYAILASAAGLAAAALAAPATADAALFGITDVTTSYTTLPPPANDVITTTRGFSVDSPVPNPLFREGRLTATGSAIDFWYIGKEAGYTNTFRSGSLLQANTGGVNSGITEANIGQGNKYGSIGHVSGQHVNFQFDSNLGTSTTKVIWDNTKNPPKQNGINSGVIFGYLKSLTDWTIVAYATNVIVFGLDDSGANVDDNHDDWVGIAMVTPIPGAVWLFGPALAGLAWLRRRKDSAGPSPAPA